MKTRLPAAALLLLLLGAGVAAQPQPPTATQPPPVPGPDLEVVSVQLAAAPPAWVEGTPRNSSVDVTLRNRGTVDAASYQLVFQWSVGAATAPLNGNLTNSFDAGENGLRAGEQRVHRFAWRVQPGQVGLGNVRVTAQVAGGGGTTGGAGDTQPNNNVGSLAVFVASRALAWEAADTPRALHPDEASFVRFTLRNLGNVAETASLSLGPGSGPGAGRLVGQLEATQLTVPAFGTARTTLFVAFPFDYDSSPITARFAVHATSGYGRVLGAQTPVLTNTFTLLDLSRLTATLEGPQEVAYAASESPVALEWTATNTGKENDTYRVTAEAASGWTLQVHSPRLGLAPGERQAIRVEALADASLAPGSAATLRVRLQSEHPVPGVNATRVLRVSGPAAEILEVQPASRIYLGDHAPLKVKWRNAGNVALPAGGLEVLAKFSDGSALSLVHPVGSLAPQQEQGSEHTVGPLGVAGALRYEVRWKGQGVPASPPLVAQAIVHDPRIDIHVPTALNGTPGESVSYSVPPHVFRIRNSGATTQALALTAFSESGRAQVMGPTEITLAPGEQQAVAVWQVLPRPLAAMGVPLELRANAPGRPDLEWQGSVTTAVVDRHGPQATVATRPAAWSLADALPVAATVTDDGAVASVHAFVTPPTGGNLTFPLSRDDQVTWRGQVLFSVAGNHTVRIVARDDTGNVGAATTWRVHVHSAPVTRLELVRPPLGVWKEGQPLEITVTGPAAPRLHFAFIRNGTVLRDGTVAVENGNATLSLDGTPAGPGLLQVRTVGTAQGVETSFDVEWVAASQDDTEPSTTSTPTPGKKPASTLGAIGGLAAVALAAGLERRRKRGG